MGHSIFVTWCQHQCSEHRTRPGVQSVDESYHEAQLPPQFSHYALSPTAPNTHTQTHIYTVCDI